MESLPGRPEGYWAQVWRRLRRDRRALFGLAVILAMMVMAVFASALAPCDPAKQVLEEAIQPPSPDHLLGTDRFGRDLLSRIIYGSRVSLKVGLISQFISIIIGTSLGAVAGYYRGRADDVVMWLVNVVWAFPALLFVIAVTLALGPGINTVYVAVALVSWVGVARIVRGQFLGIRELEYVQAARALGASGVRIIVQQILPNVMGPVIVVASLGFAGAIVAEAGLSFLGLGIQPPAASWGSMLRTGYAYFTTAWWMAVFPGVAITTAVLAFNLFGDGLRDVLDPRMKVEWRKEWG